MGGSTSELKWLPPFTMARAVSTWGPVPATALTESWKMEMKALIALVAAESERHTAENIDGLMMHLSLLDLSLVSCVSPLMLAECIMCVTSCFIAVSFSK